MMHLGQQHGDAFPEDILGAGPPLFTFVNSGSQTATNCMNLIITNLIEVCYNGSEAAAYVDYTLYEPLGLISNLIGNMIVPHGGIKEEPPWETASLLYQGMQYLPRARMREQGVM